MCAGSGGTANPRLSDEVILILILGAPKAEERMGLFVGLSSIGGGWRGFVSTLVSEEQPHTERN